MLFYSIKNKYYKMTLLYNKVSTDFLCSTDLDEHKFVKQFEECINPDSYQEYKQILIKAYIVRDLYFLGKSSVKKLFEKHIKKLGLNPTEEEKKKKREYDFFNNIKLMIKNQKFVNESIEDHYNKFINRKDNDKELENKLKYDEIMQMIEQNKEIEDIYNLFSIGDLHYIGW